MAVWRIQEGSYGGISSIMNGDDQQGPTMSDFSPSWMEDGLGISGEQGEPSFDSNQAWDTNAWSRVEDTQDEIPAGTDSTCLGDAGDPPGSGTWILGSIDGTCQWIDTTTC